MTMANEEVTREAIEAAINDVRKCQHYWLPWSIEVLIAAAQSLPTKGADAELRARIKTVENSAKINGSVAKQRGEEIKRLQELLASAPAPIPDNGGLPKSLSDYTDAEISREHHWRAVKKLGDPSQGVSLPPPPAQGGRP